MYLKDLQDDDFEIALKVNTLNDVLQCVKISDFNRKLTLIFLLQVVIVGNGAVGKSSMIQKYCRGIYTSEYKKTIGVDFLEKRVW